MSPCDRQSSCNEGEFRKELSIAKTIVSSVTASLIVAAVVNSIVFISTVSKLQTEMQHDRHRIVVLENDAKEHVKESKELSIQLVKHTATLESMIKELTDVRREYRDLILRENQNRVRNH